ncbi:MAG: hypothetical protein EXS18_04820 [Verrucomicrobiae bacterium]|nr:hypothetical protein [Verrucomicrobiae bacterium]
MKAGKARQRKLYAITAKGKAELRERMQRWRTFCRAMNLVIKDKEPS